jgi:hypothetical protein
LSGCADLLGVDLATVREVSANVKPYVPADGMRLQIVVPSARMLDVGLDVVEARLVTRRR